VVPSGASYALFEDRAVWASAEGVYWQPLSGGAPILLLARGDVGLSSVTREFVYLSSKTPFDPNVSTAQIFRVPWSGGSARTVYEETLTGYTPSLSLGAIVRGATTYILRTETQHFFWTTSTLLALRGGVARRRLSAPNAPFHVLAADEEAITVGHWVDAGGMRAIERVCAAAPKTRAVSR
jgi:hypothetical protein